MVLARPKSNVLFDGEIEKVADEEIERTRTRGQPLSLLSIRIDRAAVVLDVEDSAGAKALDRIIEACAEQLRATDVVAPIDETALVALLPSVTSSGARRAAERLRTAVAALETAVPRGLPRRITVSIGAVTTRTGRTSYGSLRSRADAKRDDASSRGGNRVNA
jgi:diguanylate cyclase (GGDEF)-like protein